MKWALIVSLLVTGCGNPPEPKEPRINRTSVPSLALLDQGSERRTEVTGSGSGASCQRVIAEQKEKARLSGAGQEAPPEHGEEIVALLNDGAYLANCDVPGFSAIDLCAAVIDGRALGVTVTLSAGTQGEANCVADQVRRIEFPSHELVSVARTTFSD